MTAPVFQALQQPQFKTGAADENSDVLFGDEAGCVLERFMVITIHQACGPGIIAILSPSERALDHPKWVRTPLPINFRGAASRGSFCWSICKHLDLSYRVLDDD